MKVTSLTRVIRVFPCGLQNGNYKQDFSKKSSNAYSNIEALSFEKIFENEKLKQKG